MLPSDSELLALLDRLDREPADALESETLEFKPWTDPKNDLKVAVEYAVCFANAQGGVVLFGVRSIEKRLPLLRRHRLQQLPLARMATLSPTLPPQGGGGEGWAQPD